MRRKVSELRSNDANRRPPRSISRETTGSTPRPDTFGLGFRRGKRESGEEPPNALGIGTLERKGREKKEEAAGLRPWTRADIKRDRITAHTYVQKYVSDTVERA